MISNTPGNFIRDDVDVVFSQVSGALGTSRTARAGLVAWMQVARWDLIMHAGRAQSPAGMGRVGS